MTERIISRLLNNRVPVFVKIMAPLVILITVTVGLSSLYVFWESTVRVRAGLNQRLERVASTVAETVDQNGLRQIREPIDANSQPYVTVQQELERLRSVATVDWVGIYYRSEDRLYYWVDVDSTRSGTDPVPEAGSARLGDGRPYPRQETTAGVGYPFLYATPEHMAAFVDQQPRYVQYTDDLKGGTFYGYVVPIVDPHAGGRPRVMGLVEASVQEESRYLIGRDTLTRVLPALAAGIVIAIGISALITYCLFTRPLGRLHQGALTLASGHLGHKIEMDSRDEIGNLAGAFNRMSVQIEQLVRERIENERLQREWEVSRLQQSEKMLEAKVAERTGELAHRNEELVRSQAELAEARDEALAASRAKSAFLANMSHELRTPLNAIIGYTEMLQEEATELGLAQIIPLAPPCEDRGLTKTGDYSGDLAKIRTAGHHLLDLINDILDLSKIEAGKMDLYLESFDICSMVDSVATTVRPLVDKHSNTLRVDCSPGVGSMTADLTKVRQVLFNLLSNAAKFTDHGQITLRVDHPARYLASGGEEPREWIEFRVTDTGIGIRPDQMLHVFEAFTQGDASTTRQHGGTGLGLAISHQFCEMMGGDIAVVSEPGSGATFTVHLPTQGAVRKPAVGPCLR